MRLINHGAFPKTERKQWRVVIFSNVVHAFQVLIGAMSEHEIEFENSENIVSSSTLHCSWLTPINMIQEIFRRRCRRPRDKHRRSHADPMSRCIHSALARRWHTTSNQERQ